jgi:hypothetical protein
MINGRDDIAAPSPPNPFETVEDIQGLLSSLRSRAFKAREDNQARLVSLIAFPESLR